MAFRLRYYAELRSKYKEVFWRAEIAERGFTGAAEEMLFDGTSPLSITWERRGDEFFIPVKGSEATINILCLENFHYLGLFTSDPRKFRVSIYRNTKLYWRGYVVADLYSENFTAPPYQVSIKAVDGFNLLSSIPFRDQNGQPFGESPRKSVWSLMAMCIDLLELGVDVADWMDLYGEGMNESQSPLRQVYIDMARLYAVYDEPTYRDILELCLRPFAGQIFQSNGALHIRRAVSLYKDNRPLSFYTIGSEFPTGWLVTADGQNLITHTGEPLITESTRERIDSMWDGHINVQGESVLDIAPALRKVMVSVTNKLQENLFEPMGLWLTKNWDDPHHFLSQPSDQSLRFAGSDAHQGVVVEYVGCQVVQSAYKTIFEYGLKAEYVKYSSGMGGARPPANYQITINYGFKVVGATATMYLRDDGTWSATELYLTQTLKLNEDSRVKIEAQGFPIVGRFVMFIKQTLEGWNNTVDYHTDIYEQACLFENLTLSVDTSDDYEDSLDNETLVNSANNADMRIELPIADLAQIPNDTLLYSLYFVDAAGAPTRMWHHRRANDCNSLVDHIILCALRYKQRPARRITGEMFTAKHIDMNTVVQDDKYLRAGFYVNSIELDALSDSYNSELVEMPGLLNRDTPAAGDDCVEIAKLPFSIKTALRCVNLVVMLTTDYRLMAYDTFARTLLDFGTTAENSQIYPADNAFVVVGGGEIRVIDYRGVVIDSLVIEHEGPATYMAGYIYLVVFEQIGRFSYSILSRPNYPFTPKYQSGVDLYTYMKGTVQSIVKAPSTLSVNTTERAYLHDRRTNNDLTMSTLEDGTQVLSVSNSFLCTNKEGQFRICRRDGRLIHSIKGSASIADHTPGEVAYLMGSTIRVWQYRDHSITAVKNRAATTEIKGFFYINGELFIIRQSQIFKYIPNGDN